MAQQYNPEVRFAMSVSSLVALHALLRREYHRVQAIGAELDETCEQDKQNPNYITRTREFMVMQQEVESLCRFFELDPTKAPA